MCWSNASLVKFLTSRVRGYLAESPKARLISISINDNGAYCQTDEELAVYAEEGGSKMAPVLRAVNQIAAALEPEYPHTLFSTLAYEFAKATPNTTRPRHNVVIRLCADGCDGGIAISGQANICRANFLDWFGILGDRQRTGGLHVWNYAANFESYLQPYPNYWAMIDDIKWFAVNKTACNDSRWLGCLRRWCVVCCSRRTMLRGCSTRRVSSPSVALHSPS